MFLVFAERIHCQYLTHHGRVTPYVGINPNTPFTRGMRPFWLHCATTKLVRSPLKAERRQNGCLGRSMVVHRTFRHRHGRHGRREALSIFKTVAKEVGRSQVAQRMQEEGTHIAVVAEWMHSGQPLVAPVKNTYCCEHCVSMCHHCASFGRPIASIERSQWRPLCLHSATTANLQPPWQWFCLHFAFTLRPVAPLQQLWSFKEGTRVVLQQLHRNRTFWVWATAERPDHFSGRSKVARRSQPCVKGA